jgi:hypothetical protein
MQRKGNHGAGYGVQQKGKVCITAAAWKSKGAFLEKFQNICPHTRTHQALHAW